MGWILSHFVLYSYADSSFAHLSARFCSDSFAYPVTHNASPSYSALGWSYLLPAVLGGPHQRILYKFSSWVSFMNDPGVLMRWLSQSNWMPGKNLSHQDGITKLLQELWECGPVSILACMEVQEGAELPASHFEKVSSSKRQLVRSIQPNKSPAAAVVRCLAKCNDRQTLWSLMAFSSTSILTVVTSKILKGFVVSC